MIFRTQKLSTDLLDSHNRIGFFSISPTEPGRSLDLLLQAQYHRPRRQQAPRRPDDNANFVSSKMETPLILLRHSGLDRTSPVLKMPPAAVEVATAADSESASKVKLYGWTELGDQGHAAITSPNCLALVGVEIAGSETIESTSGRRACVKCVAPRVSLIIFPSSRMLRGCPNWPEAP